jgi:tRNA A37 threonylcarbamoyladenosine biosynthesis protein TsaE
MATYTIVNGHDQQLVNVNAGGVHVDAYTYKDAVTLTNTELATLLDGSSFGQKNVSVLADLTGDAAAVQKKRSLQIAGFTAST